VQVVVAGGTGLIGTALTKALLARGDAVTVLTRRRRPAREGGPVFAGWDPASGRLSPEARAALGSAEAVVNLAGRTLDTRWTAAAKAEILASRLDATRTLVASIGSSPARPRLLVSASAVGYYGQDEARTFTEADPPGRGFLAEVCVRWEEAAAAAADFGVAVARLRIGVVLAREGGMLGRLLPAFRAYLGATPGDGRPWVSWIHGEDLVAVLLFLLDAGGKISGPVNAVAPSPVRMGELTRALAERMGRPPPWRVPSVLVRLAFGEMADELLLGGQRVAPAVLDAHALAAVWANPPARR
jgi:uncharacterized protein (TIGR01777 family)